MNIALLDGVGDNVATVNSADHPDMRALLKGRNVNEGLEAFTAVCVTRQSSADAHLDYTVCRSALPNGQILLADPSYRSVSQCGNHAGLVRADIVYIQTAEK